MKREKHEQVQEMMDQEKDPKFILKQLLDRDAISDSDLTFLKQMELFGVLAPGLAHNLGSSLTALKGYAQLIQSEYEGLEEIDLILEETSMIEQIVNNLMIRSRKYWEQKEEIFNFNDLIHIELDFLQANLLFKHRIKQELRLEESLPSIYGIYVDFSQLFIYLVQNSIEAMANSGTKILTITTKSDSNQVHLTITDTGSGMSDELLEKIFDPGFTTKHQKPGAATEEPVHLGMGLSCVSDIIEKYQATMDITSSPSRGTSIHVVIPIPEQ